MAKAVALIRANTRTPFERQQALDLARGAVVTACALALVAAGPFLPTL